MNTLPSLGTLIVEIIRHTPLWAWGILAGLVALGVKQMRDQVVSRSRLLAPPLGLGLYSLVGAIHSFGPRAEVVAAWLIGMAVVVAWQLARRQADEMHLEADGRIVVHGSIRPLLAMVSVFGLRYVVAVASAISPAFASGSGFTLGMALAYGALSGLFAGRALRLLRHAGVPATASVAPAAP